MDRQVRKEVLDFLTPLPIMQSEASRRAALYAAGLDVMLIQTDLSGAAAQVVPLLLNALEVDGEPALVLLLRYAATQVGSDKQKQIQDWCAQIFQQAADQAIMPPQASDPVPSPTPPPAIERDVFICYAREDLARARHLYAELECAGVSPWLDTEDLLGGQKWEMIIQQAMRDCSYVLILLSRCSVTKRGFVQHEIRHALKLAEDFPSSAIYIIPVRLEACDPPSELNGLHWTDLFPDHEAGVQKLLNVLAPEGREALLQRKIHLLTAEFQRLQREKGLETETHALTDIETEITTVQAQRQQAETQLQDLHESPHKATHEIAWRTVRDGERIVLRSEPQTVSADDFKTVFGLDKNRQPLEYVQNQYEDRGDVVFDAATGLLWQKAGSDWVGFNGRQRYVESLNAQKFAGFNDWRLPTIPELMSLLEPAKKKGSLYIDPIFDETKRWCWSSDLRIKDEDLRESAWLVHFNNGSVHWVHLPSKDCVRAVRSTMMGTLRRFLRLFEHLTI